jgi:pyruvate dehydrogenase E1 component beta subunit
VVAVTAAQPRVAERLGAALHRLMADFPTGYVLGEDIADPYGGAFRVTKGLSTAFPGRVRATPLSEGAIVGVANGLALCGDPVIVEMMFGDFIALAFDQIVNFAANSVAMYGQRQRLPVVVRCPVGAGRGYGPTHSGSPQKYFLGAPHLRLAELTPFHDPWHVLHSLLDGGEPGIHFEDKVLYTRPAFAPGRVDELFRWDLPDGPHGWARVYQSDPDVFDAVILCTGGMAHRAIEAARTLLLQHEVLCQILVPAWLHPFDVTALADLAAGAGLLCVAEDGSAGGSWAETVALAVHQRAWRRLRRPVAVVQPPASVIPTAAHLERAVTVGPDVIVDTVLGGLRA